MILDHTPLSLKKGDVLTWSVREWEGVEVLILEDSDGWVAKGMYIGEYQPGRVIDNKSQWQHTEVTVERS